MRTFDWSLFELYNSGDISYDEAIRNADSANELRLNIKLNGTRPPPSRPIGAASGHDGFLADNGQAIIRANGAFGGDRWTGRCGPMRVNWPDT